MSEDVPTRPAGWAARRDDEGDGGTGAGAVGTLGGDAALRRALDAMADCLCICTAVRDAAGRITDFRVEWMNDAACRNNRMTRDAQIGRLLCELLPAHRTSGLFNDYVRVVETGTPYAREHCVYRDMYGDGRVLERAFDLHVVRHGDGFVATWRDVTARAQETATLIRSASLAERLQAFSAALARAMTPDDVIDVIVLHGRAAVGAQACAVVTPAADDPTQLETVRSEGFDVAELAEWSRFPLSAPVPMAEAFRTGEPVWVAGLDAVEARFPAVLPFALATGFGGWLAIPFVLGEQGGRRVVGGFGVAFATRQTVTDDDRDFLHTLGRQAAQALERARLVAALDTERALLDAVIGQMPLAMVVADAPAGTILFANAAAERLLGHPIIQVESEGGYAAYGALHADGTPYAAHEYPMVRALAGETVDQHVMRYRRGDGTITHLSVSAAPVTDGSGRLVRAVCTWSDVHERIVLEGALRTARDAADAANRAKSEFLANMSHELRTPLNAIQGHVQLMELGIHGAVTDPQRDALARVTRAQRHLLGLINDVLNFAKLESGHVEYQIARVPLDDALRDAAAIIEPQMLAAGLDFTLAVTTPRCVVLADADKLRQVLLNLLSNATKFTPSGGRVVLEAGRVDDTSTMVHIVVRDTGIGIAPEKQAAVFEPFVQVHAGPTRTQQGTGLGLAISRDLARGMGGDLLLRSAVGEGAEFRLVLPCACEGRT